MDKLKVMLMLLGFENQGKIDRRSMVKLDHIRLHIYMDYVAYYHKKENNSNNKSYIFIKHFFTNDTLFPNDLIGFIKDDIKNYNKEVP